MHGLMKNMGLVVVLVDPPKNSVPLKKLKEDKKRKLLFFLYRCYLFWEKCIVLEKYVYFVGKLWEGVQDTSHHHQNNLNLKLGSKWYSKGLNSENKGEKICF